MNLSVGLAFLWIRWIVSIRHCVSNGDNTRNRFDGTFRGTLIRYCLTGTAIWRLLLLCGASLSTWWLTAGFVVGFPLQITFKSLVRSYGATALGARPVDVPQGEVFGNIDLMLNLVEHLRSGYPGANHRLLSFSEQNQDLPEQGME